MPAHRETPAGPAIGPGPAQIVFVRLPADAPLQPGEPRPARRTSKPRPKATGPRRSPAKGRRGKQEKKKMIKTFIALVASVAIYVLIGGYVPISGHQAVVFPVLRLVPAVGMWLCFLTYKGILSLAAFSAIAK